MGLWGMTREDIKKLWPRLVLAVGLWSVCAVLGYQWAIVMDAKYRVNVYPGKVAQAIEDVATNGGGSILVSESGNGEASLLVAVPASTVAEIEDFLSIRHERIGSKLSMWENSDSVLVNVEIGLSEEQATALRAEVEGQLTSDALVTIFIVWLGVAMFIWLGALAVRAWIVTSPQHSAT